MATTTLIEFHILKCMETFLAENKANKNEAKEEFLQVSTNYN